MSADTPPPPPSSLEARGAAYLSSHYPQRTNFTRDDIAKMMRALDTDHASVADDSSFSSVDVHIRAGRKLLASKALPPATTGETKLVGVNTCFGNPCEERRLQEDAF